jgi:asparagine synthase (glutamine-hydrolysing)
VEFAATVPFHLKFQGGQSKRLVKRAVESLLPARLRAQRKRGFAMPVNQWFRSGLGGHFEEAVLGADARCRSFLEPAVVQALLDAHRAGRDNHGYHLWAILMFEHWLRYMESTSGIPGL